MRFQTLIRQKSIAFAILLFAALPFVSSAKQPAVPVLPCESCADYTPGFIALPAEWAADTMLTTAAAELSGTLNALYGKRPAIINDSRLTLSHGNEGIIVIGKGNRFIEHLSLKNLEYKDLLPEESFSIATGKTYDNRPAILIEGGDIRGCINGIYFLLEKLLIDPRSVLDITALRQPAFRIRIAYGEPPAQAARLGYNTVTLGTDYSETVSLEKSAPGMFDRHRPARHECAKQKKYLSAGIAEAQRFHLDTVSVSSEFKFNRLLLNTLAAGKLLSAGGDRNIICPCNAETMSLLSEKYTEVAASFPDLGFAAISLGDTDTPDFFGNSAAPPAGFQSCIECSFDTYPARTGTFIRTVWDAYVGDSGRKLIQRAWAPSESSFHADPDNYSAVSEQMAGRKNIYFSLKYTLNDFQPGGFPNPNIGRGEIPQIIEFQCQRKHEGMGAFPSWLGKELSDAYIFAAERGAQGAWNFHRAENSSAKINTDIWNQANAYAAAHLAWDPKTPPETLAHDWAAITFGRRHAENIAKILEISEEATRKLFYFDAYSAKKKSALSPNEDWITPAGDIRGAEALRKIYSAAPEIVDDIIKEKEAAVVLIERMNSIATDLTLPEKSKQPVTDSLMAELLLARALRDYVAAYFYHCRWTDKGGFNDRALAISFARKWKIEWKYYKTDVVKMKYASNIFRDGGMEKTMQAILKDLGE